MTSFAAFDALLVELKRRWPDLQSLTLAGFSAGAQFLQRHVAFGADAPAGLRMRYVLADPGTWLYFDPLRPRLRRDGQSDGNESDCGSSRSVTGAVTDRAGDCSFELVLPDVAACPGYDRWKYGTQRLPAGSVRGADGARARYRAADLSYLVGALDSGPGRGTADKVLDHGCAAQLQGRYRLQRAQGYLAYEQQVLQPPTARTLTIVPDCAHDVRCVLPSQPARAVLFGEQPR